MGETRVDLLHLLEDLRDAYPESLEETILTEVIANALDSGASRILIVTDPAGARLTIVDDGTGMRRRELAKYHDLAASSKTRGRGIGFAGVGIKLGLLVCDEVRTETRRGTVHVSSSWALRSRQRAPWHWVPPEGLLAERGTAVRLTLQNPLSLLLDPGFVEAALRRHYLPLFHPPLRATLADHYPSGITFWLNGEPLEDEPPPLGEVVPMAIRLPRKRKPSAQGWLARAGAPLPEERQGIAVSTFGKVIKRGWDWLGVSPANPERITGLIEAPALAEALTLNKADFIRAGARGALYLGYRKALQEIVSAQLVAWGDRPGILTSERRRASRPIERDLQQVLAALSQSFPMLATLVEHRPGGQRPLPFGGGDGDGNPGPVPALAGTPSPEESKPDPGPRPEAAAPPESPPAPPAASRSDLDLPGPRKSPRPARLGLSIRFEPGVEKGDLARVEDTTVWVNESHPAYRRAAASRSEGYHLALAVALALAPLAAELANERAFVTAFLARWGRAMERATRRRR